VVTQVTLRTHDLPAFLGGVHLAVRAASDAACRRLIERFVGFYRDSLFNPHWGESVTFGPGNSLNVGMAFHGLDRAQALAVWRPFLDFVAASPGELALTAPPRIGAVPARDFWNAADLVKTRPKAVIRDDRPGAPAGNLFWADNLGEAGMFLNAYKSAWLPASLLEEYGRQRLADALFAASRHWWMALHFNKGLAGAPAGAIAAARDTATHPAMVDAFALAITAAAGPPAFPHIPGHAPDIATARREAGAVGRAMDAVSRLVPGAGSYVSESDYFEGDWSVSFWGSNYPRLAAVKRDYDPGGLFFVHHGVGSEGWSPDGFERVG
jgi:FAD/FMN-containing dehydrogenase